MPLHLPRPLLALLLLVPAAAGQEFPEHEREPSAAFRWLDVVLEACARDVERVGARPTILSRQMALPLTAMYEAWAAHDAVAVGPVLRGAHRRPPAARTTENAEEAIAHAVYRVALDQLPHHAEYLRAEMIASGHDPDLEAPDAATPAGLGQLVARELLAARRHDGANQHGDERGGDGTPYGDYTMYRPVNPPDHVFDPDRWQPIPFDDGAGGQVVFGFLTPHWYRVRPFALASADAFRPGPPPLVGSPELEEQVAECVRLNASLDPEQKAIVEFMRDGPRSTGQSGHWLRFAQAVSRRDGHDLGADVRLFFTVGNVAFDAFIAAWDSKRYHDSSRPWTLVRHLYAGQRIQGWAGPGKGVTTIPAEEWHPYSPSTFVTPPFPGYVSGHSCVSGACARALALFTGSDRCGMREPRRAGDLTEPGFTCRQMQQLDGRPLAELLGERHASCDVVLELPTFTEVADMAGISRVLGGYHIQADNVAGLELGRQVASSTWPVYQALFRGDLSLLPDAGDH